MNVKTPRTLFLIVVCLALVSCTKESREDSVANSAEVKAFLTHFFITGTKLIKNETEDFSLQTQYAEILTGADTTCSSESLCNKTKDYFLEFTPNFLFGTINGRTIVSEADPDAFVDLCDIRGTKVYRVLGTGTEGSIYGTFWLSDYAFVVYGMESNEGFADVFDIKAKTKTSYSIDKEKRKPHADLDAFLIDKYGHADSF
ncbi:MAG: hypothetical protein A2X56_14190 [Nitrospirae bacterium GWC2_57_13]|nr:MAG: hypothetical protein A2X56_14190 [Nitrospirae bacterium GWC2_57_13]OGW44161.1 MAG: hypothetical protein A2X57_10275 [Nitrospirae bacterium GWD2_57_8]HAS54786.1 hypothetical protein [Nitrospiraceae bacterium]